MFAEAEAREDARQQEAEKMRLESIANWEEKYHEWGIDEEEDTASVEQEEEEEEEEESVVEVIREEVGIGVGRKVHPTSKKRAEEEGDAPWHPGEDARETEESRQ